MSALARCELALYRLGGLIAGFLAAVLVLITSIPDLIPEWTWRLVLWLYGLGTVALLLLAFGKRVPEVWLMVPFLPLIVVICGGAICLLAFAGIGLGSHHYDWLRKHNLSTHLVPIQLTIYLLAGLFISRYVFHGSDEDGVYTSPAQAQVKGAWLLVPVYCVAVLTYRYKHLTSEQGSELQ